MPPRTASASRVLQSRQYICVSCRLNSRAYQQQQRPSPPTPPPSRPRPQLPSGNTIAPQRSRRVSLASNTALNAPTSVPPRLHKLYQSLVHLQTAASSYLQLSRLQLALRCLQSSDPVIRVAFLGLGVHGDRAARRLVRVLLADALGDAPEAWERELLDARGGSVLLTYGETIRDVGVVGVGGGGGGGGRLREWRVPSPVLKRWGVEILLTGLNASGEEARAQEGWEDAILVPVMTTPEGGGRVAFVSYPVHKAVVVAEGASGAVALGRLPSGLWRGNLIRSALSLPLRTGEGIAKDEEEAGLVDVGLAEHALELFRTDRANGAVFSREWQASKVGSISNWLAESTKAEIGDELQPAVRHLLDSVLAKTSAAVDSADTATRAEHSSLSVPDATRSTLREAIGAWSQDAHHDLQTNLSTAFLGPAWKRTTWWRLFWRIDEVSLSAADVLRRGWLVEAEQNLAFLSGRLLESGVATQSQLRGISLPTSEGDTGAVDGKILLDERTELEMADYNAAQKGIWKDGRPDTVAELMQIPPLLSQLREQTGLNALYNPPWPQTITLAREQMLHEAVPALHAKAQRLLLGALSTIGGTGALGAWLWAASGGLALYEGGAIAALGLVWALSRLQRGYGKERDAFAGTVGEDARRVLAEVEMRLRRLVDEGGRVAVREEDMREREEARRVLRAAREALEAVRSRDGTDSAV